MNKEQGKKKKGEEKRVEEVTEESEETSMEIDIEVSKGKDVNQQVIGNKDKERDKEKEINNTCNAQEKDLEIEKTAKMIKKNGRHEDMTINEGEKRIIEEKCYKSNHKGDIIVQARIKEKYVTKSRTNNMIRIAREVNCRALTGYVGGR